MQINGKEISDEEFQLAIEFLIEETKKYSEKHAAYTAEEHQAAINFLIEEYKKRTGKIKDKGDNNND